MKAMIGVGIFEKEDMIEWHLRGISENFPQGTEVVFYFEACKDGSEAQFDKLAPEILIGKKFSKGSYTEHLLEVGVHCWLIDRFLESDCDVLVIPQDDNRFTQSIMTSLHTLWDRYGTRLGWISGRDGYGYGYSGMVCSPFSDSNATKRCLPIGDFEEVLMMNTGPVVYFRHVVKKVGKPDTSLPWFFWDDLCLRCHENGMVNVLLSMPALHTKFGRVGNNPDLFKPELVARCLKTFQDRWRDKHGRNPL